MDKTRKTAFAILILVAILGGAPQDIYAMAAESLGSQIPEQSARLLAGGASYNYLKWGSDWTVAAAKTGGLSQADADKGFGPCSTGKQQSPIILVLNSTPLTFLVGHDSADANGH
jgi:hypothetical protein